MKLFNFKKKKEIKAEEPKPQITIENGRVVDTATDLRNAPEYEGIYLLGQCNFNPYTNEQQYWIKIGKSKNIQKRLKSYLTYCPCTVLLDTLRCDRFTSVIENFSHDLMREFSIGKCQHNSEWWLVSKETYMGFCEQKLLYLKNDKHFSNIYDMLMLQLQKTGD
ncbi:MAG: GIY-YIG nuclease family protein [Clostridia bacterium]|nr:GIY-YIG nuclease family protein [Clostridia bacterium]